jgi:hypothetical protein
MRQFAADGFNTVIAVPAELPRCREYGLQAILAADAATATNFIHDPSIWGYFILDEPARKHIPYDTVAAKVAEFHRLDSNRPAYVNLNELDDPAEFIRVARPRVLSYDYYQWWAGREPFFPLLEKFSAAARDAGIPLIAWVEAVCVPGGAPVPANNLAKIRLSVNSLLAYGAKGIQWWAWRPDNRDAGTVNAALRRLGPALAPLRHVAAFHTAPVPEGSRAIPTDCWVQSPTEGLLLGLFQDGRGEDYVYVVNRSYDRPAEAVLTMARPSAVRALELQSGRWAAKGQGLVRQRLEGGGGVLLHVSGGR